MSRLFRILARLMPVLLLFAAPAAEAQKRIALTFDDVPRSRGPFLTPEERTEKLIAGLREAGVKTPVLFLTSLSDEIYEEAGLRYGAVDFIEKSRSFSIILQRLRLRLEMLAEERRAGPAQLAAVAHDIFRRGELELKTETSRATWRAFAARSTGSGSIITARSMLKRRRIRCWVARSATTRPPSRPASS